MWRVYAPEGSDGQPGESRGLRLTASQRWVGARFLTSQSPNLESLFRSLKFWVRGGARQLARAHRPRIAALS